MYAENFNQFVFRATSSLPAISSLSGLEVLDSNLYFTENYLQQLEKAGALISSGGENISTGSIVSIAGSAIAILGVVSGNSSIATIGLIGGGVLSIAGVITTLMGGIKIQEGGKLLQPKKSY